MKMWKGRILYTFVTLVICEAVWAFDREKRSLFNFYGVVRCATGRNPLTAYNGYGCYCGKGGAGQAIDEIDRCCLAHDECYRNLRDQGACNKLTRYIDSYDWECVPGKDVTRSVDSSYLAMLQNITSRSNAGMNQTFDTVHFNLTQFHNSTNSPIVTSPLVNDTRKYPICKKSKTDCGAGLCLCDVQAAVCFAENQYPKSKPMCSQQ